jgi:hypothetical protein
MIYLLALLPATALTVAGYVALFLSTRSAGGMQTFGKFLGFWAFTLAALVMLGALFAAAHHRHHGMRGAMHCPWNSEPGVRPAPPGPPPPGAPQTPSSSQDGAPATH